MPIIKTEEKALAELFQKFRLDDRRAIAGNIKDIIITAITCIAKLQPNLTPDNPLTLLEMIYLILLVTGKNPDQCADLLGVEMVTVQNTEKRIRKKLGARNRTHAFYIASVRGFLTFIH